MTESILRDNPTNIKQNGLMNSGIPSLGTRKNSQTHSLVVLDPSTILTERFQNGLHKSFYKETDLKSIEWLTAYKPKDSSRKTKQCYKAGYANGGNWVNARRCFIDVETGEEVPMESPFTSEDGTPKYTKKDKRIDGTKTNSMTTCYVKLNQVDWTKVKTSPICYTLTVGGDSWERNHKWWNDAFKRFRSRLDYWLNKTIPNGKEDNELLSNHDWSTFCGLWVKQYQMKYERGAIHYHIVFYNAPNGKDTIDTHIENKWTLHAFGKKINKMWHESIYQTKELREANHNNYKGGQDWEYVRDAEGIISYLSKYLTGSDGQKGLKDSDDKSKHRVPEWVVKSDTGSRHWGYIRMKTFKQLINIEEEFISIEAYRELKRELNKETNIRMFSTSLKKGKSIAKRIGNSHDFEVYGVIGIPEAYEGEYKGYKNKNKRKYSFYVDVNGDPRVTHRIKHCKAERTYFLCDMDGVVLDKLKDLKDYRILRNPAYVRNYSLTVPICKLLEREGCRTLKEELLSSKGQIIDFRTLLTDKKLLTDKAVA